jgi:hypothetical protein
MPLLLLLLLSLLLPCALHGTLLHLDLRPSPCSRPLHVCLRLHHRLLTSRWRLPAHARLLLWLRLQVLRLLHE